MYNPNPFNFNPTVYADVVESNMTLAVGQPVQLIGIGQKMCISGYVPCDFDVDMVLPALELSNAPKIAESIVINFIARHTHSYIVTRTVRKISEEKVLLDKFIDIPKYSCNVDENTAQHFVAMRLGLAVNKITEANWHCFKMTKDFECKGSSVFYTPCENELIFTKNINQRVSIAQHFLCLCTYTNPINGRVEYQIFNPKELVRIDSLE